MSIKNILVVDDELPIQEWLKFSIEKEFNNDINVFIAGNGLEAWNLFQKNSINLIFTDIKMPKMDGLELIKKIRLIDSDVYITVLTSYNDFEYARAAVSYHANDYILKTEITGELLKQIILKKISLQELSFKKEKELFSLDDICKAIYDFTYNNISSDTLGQSFHIPKSGYFCFSLLIPDGTNFNLNTGTSLNQLLFIEYENNKHICIMEYVNIESFIMQTNIMTNYIKSLKELYPDIIISYYSKSSQQNNLITAIQNASKGLSYCFYSNSGIINAATIPEGDDTTSLNSLSTIYLSIVQAIKTNDMRQIDSLPTLFFDELKKSRPLNVLKVKELCKQICAILISSFTIEPDEQDSLESSINKNILAANNVDSLRSATENGIKQILNSSSINHADNIYIQSALQYISINYGTINNISEVANFVNLKKDVFAKLFKENTSLSFNTYLNNYRLDKAQNLMRSTNKTISEIAFSVGFSSLSYFSKCFKKRYGTNPLAAK